MTAVTQPRMPHLADRLPPVRGRLTVDAPLSRHTWFGVGGPADVLFRPADRDDLAAFMAALPADVPVTVIGVASNLLIRDGGVRGVVIRLGRGFADIACAGDRVTAGAGALDLNVALTARDHGLGGLEFLSGIPGTIGGAVRMNAGAYGGELSDLVLSAETVDRAGAVHHWAAADLGFSYRHSTLPEDHIVTAAVLRGCPAERGEVAARIVAIETARQQTQPRSRTGGSTFVNPPGARAWELIDRAGCRGLRLGGAQVSELHCNFLVNAGDATAADVEALGEEVRRRVLAHSGVALQWEIRRLGEPAPGQAPVAPGVEERA